MLSAAVERQVIKCDCGFVVRGNSDDELVEAAKAHAREVHKMDFDAAQVLAMAEPGEMGG